MTILGIDPGSTRIGFGLIADAENRKLVYIDCGVLESHLKGADALLLQITQDFAKLIKKHCPDLIGIEKLYFAKNVKTGIAVAQTRGAIIAAAAQFHIPIQEFSPSEIKSATTNYGLADKKAVSRMVSVILGIGKVPGYDDASDALAIAITTAMHRSPLDTK